MVIDITNHITVGNIREVVVVIRKNGTFVIRIREVEGRVRRKVSISREHEVVFYGIENR